MATLRSVSIVLLACAMFALAAAKKEMKAGTSKVDIDDNGEMTFRHGRGNGSGDAFPLKIRLDELSQVDESGKELTDCGEPSNSTSPGMGWMKHTGQKRAEMKGMMKKFRKFADQKFAFGQKKMNQQMHHGKTGMKAQMLKFNTALADGLGKMTIEMAALDTAGDINIDGEKQTLKKGDMKFNLEMSDWSWCDNAAFLDVYLVVVGKQTPKKRTARSKARPATYYMGDNVTVSFSGKYQNDSGVWVDMLNGYPKVDSGNTSRIIVRFARFNETLLYDPTVSGVEDGNDDVSSGSCLRVSAIVIMITTAVYAML